MSIEIRPFRGLRPRDKIAGDVIAPPYDVLSEDEVRAQVAMLPNSFLRVTRSEVELPEGADAHSEAAYAKARENLLALIEAGQMVRDDASRFYLYKLTREGRTQTGLMCLCSVEDYNEGRIKRHELTRPDKEQDRVDHINHLDAQTGLVFLAYRDQDPALAAAMAAAAATAPAWEVTTDDGVIHALTVVSNPDLVTNLKTAFDRQDALYIADGHHRAAAASRVAAARDGAGTSGWFLAGLFPDSELEVLSYNRLVKDLNGLSKEQLFNALNEHFELSSASSPAPSQPQRWTMYLDGAWYALRARDGVIPNDPVGGLDVSVLQDRVLGPLLGIENPRTDQRISFVGGVRGHASLSAAVDRGDAQVAFHLYATSMAELFAVADAGLLMPPKSTWFEPKLRGGVVTHLLT